MKSLTKLFFIFFKIGIMTIGGGLVMIPLMHNEFVEKQKWVDDEKMTDIFSVVQALPGVIAVNSSIYIGYELRGFIGALVATAGVILPSFLCILIIFFTLETVGDNILLAKFYTGIRAAVVGLIAFAALKLSKNSIKDVFGILVAIFGIAATLFLRLDIALIVIISGFTSYAFYTVKETRFGSS